MYGKLRRLGRVAFFLTVLLLAFPPQLLALSLNTRTESSSSPAQTSNLSNRATKRAVLSAPTSLASQQSVGSSSSQTMIVASGFDGLDMITAGSVPPDVQVAVGDQYVVEMVNKAVEIWTTQGVEVKTVDTRSFFNMSSYGADPKILFDKFSGRWFASAISPVGVRLAVSKTNSPVDDWWFYDFPDSYFPDQPIIGVSEDKLVISVNAFTCSTCFFVGAQFWVARKADLLVGSPINSTLYGPTGQWSSFASIHPAQSLSSTLDLFMIDSVGSFCCYLFQVSGVPPNVAVQSWSYNINSVPYSYPPPAPQNGTTVTLDVGDTRIQDAYWASGKLWLVFNDGCTPQGDTQLRSCIRLAQIDTAFVGTVYQNFDLRSTGEYYFYPALRPDGRGNLVVVFGYSSSTDYPGLMVTAQPFGESPNMVEPPVVLKSGLGPVSVSGSSPTRYGDYFGAATDPSNSTLVWVAGEYGELLSNGQYGWASFVAEVAELYHDVAVTRFQVSRTTAYSGVSASPVQVNVTVSDLGLFPETFWVAALASTTLIGNQTLTLNPGLSEVVSFNWLPGQLPRGIYQLAAEAQIVPGDVNSLNNNSPGEVFQVRYQGDVNGDCRVNITDLVLVAISFGTVSGTQGYTLDADLNNDGRINIVDIVVVASNFGQTCP